jgi:hypothetical protein
VNDGFNILSLPVDRNMHSYFTGHSFRASQLPTFKIDDHHIRGSNQVLAGSGGTGQYPFFIQSYRQISGCAWHESKPVQPFAKPDEFAPQCIFPWMVFFCQFSLLSEIKDAVRLRTLGSKDVEWGRCCLNPGLA